MFKELEDLKKQQVFNGVTYNAREDLNRCILSLDFCIGSVNRKFMV